MMGFAWIADGSQIRMGLHDGSHVIAWHDESYVVRMMDRMMDRIGNR